MHKLKDQRRKYRWPTHRSLPREVTKDEYAMLEQYTATRTREVSSMLAPYVDATDRYGRLLCRLCVILGDVEPKSVQDAVLRDLMADVFDFLYESRVFILKGQTVVAYPLARRAYESLSLLVWCALDANAAEQWSNGKQFNNKEVRRALGTHKFGESEEELREMYKFFSQLTHPNRETIAYRGLGEGNQFVLGSIDRPNLVILSDYCMKHLGLWFWFCPVVAYFYRDLVLQKDETFVDDHNRVRQFAQEVHSWLVDQFNRLLEEWRKEKDRVKPRFGS